VSWPLAYATTSTPTRGAAGLNESAPVGGRSPAWTSSVRASAAVRSSQSVARTRTRDAPAVKLRVASAPVASSNSPSSSRSHAYVSPRPVPLARSVTSPPACGVAGVAAIETCGRLTSQRLPGSAPCSEEQAPARAVAGTAARAAASVSEVTSFIGAERYCCARGAAPMQT
jgi:hypothetical protein